MPGQLSVPIRCEGFSTLGSHLARVAAHRTASTRWPAGFDAMRRSACHNGRVDLGAMRAPLYPRALPRGPTMRDESSMCSRKTSPPARPASLCPSCGYSSRRRSCQARTEAGLNLSGLCAPSPDAACSARSDLCGAAPLGQPPSRLIHSFPTVSPPASQRPASTDPARSRSRSAC